MIWIWKIGLKKQKITSKSSLLILTTIRWKQTRKNQWKAGSKQTDFYLTSNTQPKIKKHYITQIWLKHSLTARSMAVQNKILILLPSRKNLSTQKSWLVQISITKSSKETSLKTILCWSLILKTIRTLKSQTLSRNSSEKTKMTNC